MRNLAYNWNSYLKQLMKALQNKARQKVFKGLKDGTYVRTVCVLCGDADTSAFYASYEKQPQITWFCQSCHKEQSQNRGSIYDQLVRHGVPVISWEEWKNGLRPAAKIKKRK